jgi:hypothetical protein
MNSGDEGKQRRGGKVEYETFLQQRHAPYMSSDRCVLTQKVLAWGIVHEVAPIE